MIPANQQAFCPKKLLAVGYGEISRNFSSWKKLNI